MLAYRLDAGLPQDRVIALPAEHLVREQIQVFVDAEAAAREDLADRHAVRLVGVAGHQMVLHGPGKPSRRGTVVGSDDAVADERAIERNDGVAAARQGVVAEANAVQDTPAGERQDRCSEEGGRPGDPLPRSALK